MPITFTIVADIYPREKIGEFQGLFGSIFALSSILGPDLGGAIAEFSNWGWMFYMNLLLGMPAFFIMMAAFKESKSIEKRSIDWFGAITLSSAIILILLTLVLGGNSQGTGVSPFYAGYILTPLMIAVVISMNLGGRLMSKVSYRTILVPSLALIAVGFLLLSQMTVNTTKLQIVLYMVVTRLGMGAIYHAIGTAAQMAVDSKKRGVATFSPQFFRSIGGTIFNINIPPVIWICYHYKRNRVFFTINIL